MSGCNHLNGGYRLATDRDIRDWQRHDPGKLAIRHKCPNCDGIHTLWIGSEYHICYDCRICFTYEDMAPVSTPERVSDYQAQVEQALHMEYDANKLEQIASDIERMFGGSQ